MGCNSHRRTQFEDVAKQRPQLSDSEISQAHSSLSKCYRVYSSRSPSKLHRRRSISFAVYTCLLEARTAIYTVQPDMSSKHTSTKFGSTKSDSHFASPQSADQVDDMRLSIGGRPKGDKLEFISQPHVQSHHHQPSLLEYSWNRLTV